MLAINMGALPGFYVLSAEKWILASIQAHHEVTGGKPVANKGELGRVSIKHKKLFLDGVGSGDLMKAQMMEKTAVFQDLVNVCDPEIQDIVYGIFKGMIIQAWTAFEVLLADLVRRMQRVHNTLLPQGKFGFDSRLRFRESYRKVFNDAGINAILNDPIIDALALVRNVLVHANGLADERFLSVKENAYPVNPILKQHFPNMILGAKVSLNGEIVRAIMEPCLIKGSDLAVEVDNWLERNL